MSTANELWFGKGVFGYMMRDPFKSDESPDLQEVLDVLEDPACRVIVQRTETPMTAEEVSNTTDVPLSTTYRKLDRLSEASLLRTQTEISQDGHHRTRYRADIKEITIWLDDERDFEVSIVRPPEAPDQQLASIWDELRRET